ncbi:AEC family transporter [Neobacillus dielmonensis]|uniref:AEC family transporter n=1 Tax=Neobacillus dielmonensis TaxID=1347369 RepID=UPI0005A8A279|nr:AEC family transporter [Neobacillus dielmonensis]
MSSVWGFSQEMITLYGISLLGFILRKTGTLNEHTNDVLTQLILYGTLPALILLSLDISFSFTLVKELTLLITMSIFILTISCFIAAWMRKHSKLPDQQKSVYEGLIIFGNQGFIGYAVSYLLFGDKGIVIATMFNLCYFVLIWTYGIYLFTKNKDRINWRNIFFNPGIVATLIGLIFMFSPLSWPEVVANGLESVGKMTIPLSMILIGSLVANAHPKEFFTSLKNQYLWKSAFAKLLFIPLFLLPFAFFSVPFPLLATAVIVSGMPSASTVSLYAQRYGADALFGSFGVLLTTLLCLVSIPILYWICTIIY